MNKVSDGQQSSEMCPDQRVCNPADDWQTLQPRAWRHRPGLDSGLEVERMGRQAALLNLAAVIVAPLVALVAPLGSAGHPGTDSCTNVNIIRNEIVLHSTIPENAERSMEANR
jgi:hypothetical protein